MDCGLVPTSSMGSPGSPSGPAQLQVQYPLEHPSPAGQALPQPPQLAGSVSVSTHIPPHIDWADWHPPPPAPELALEDDSLELEADSLEPPPVPVASLEQLPAPGAMSKRQAPMTSHD